ncbi:unnamed protein product [Urochloa humidicola]
MRAARMVHSADSLLKLVSELKRTAIFSGLASLNENVDRTIELLGQQADGTERMLERIGQEAAASLKELESQCPTTTHLLCGLHPMIEGCLSW